MKKEYKLLIKGINGDVAAIKRFNRTKVTSSVTFKGILQILSTNDLSLCPSEALTHIKFKLLDMPDRKVRPLIMQLVKASENLAAQIFLVAYFHAKSHLTEEELGYFEKAKQFVIRKAEKEKHHEAICALGIIETDGRKALQHYQVAADLGNAAAMCNLAVKYFKGEYVNKDYTKTRKLFEMAAEQDEVYAISMLGYIYRKGNGVEKDINKAIEYYEKGVMLGDDYSMQILAKMYKIGKEVKKDRERAFKLFSRAADLGDKVAMTWLASMYFYGEGIEQNHVKAKKLYREAANLGYSIAMNNLAELYENGEFDDELQDCNKARKLYRKAAKLGNKNAMENLAWMYFRGENIEQSYSKAKKFFRKAGKLGSTRSLTHLANMYRDGIGIEMNHRKARKLYQKAANLGSYYGMSELAYMHQCGMGGKRDYFIAARWYCRAARNKLMANITVRQCYELKVLFNSADLSIISLSIETANEIYLENYAISQKYRKERYSRRNKILDTIKGKNIVVDNIGKSKLRHIRKMKENSLTNTVLDVIKNSKLSQINTMDEMSLLLKKIYMNNEDGEDGNSFKFLLAKILMQNCGGKQEKFSSLIDPPQLIVNIFRYLIVPGAYALADIRKHADKISNIINNGRDNTYLHRLPAELLVKINLFCIRRKNRDASELSSLTKKELFEAAKISSFS